MLAHKNTLLNLKRQKKIATTKAILLMCHIPINNSFGVIAYFQVCDFCDKQDILYHDLFDLSGSKWIICFNCNYEKDKINLFEPKYYALCCMFAHRDIVNYIFSFII